MSDNRRDPLYQIISTLPEGSEELRRRFEEQAAGLASGRISYRGRVARIAAAAALSIPAALFAVMAASMFFQPAPRWADRTTFTVAFIAGFLVFAGGAVHYAYEVNKGSAAPRRMQWLSFGIRYGSAAVFGILLPMMVFAFRWMGDDATAVLMITVLVSTIYWSILVVLAVHRIVSHYRDEVILEQKRTQLEIALLSEAILARAKE